MSTGIEGLTGGPGEGPDGGGAPGPGGTNGASPPEGSGEAKPEGGTPPPEYSFPEAYQELAERKGWKGPEDAFKAYQGAEKLLGDPAKLIKLPTDPEDAEAWGEIWAKLGRPGGPDGYQLPESGTPEGMPDITADFRNWAHDLGLTQKQAEGLLSKYAERMNGLSEEMTGQQRAALEDKIKQGQEEIRKAWGSRLNQASMNVEAAVNEFSLEWEQVDAMRDALGPVTTFNLLEAIGRKMAEPMAPGDSGPGNFEGSPAWAKEQISAKLADPAFAKAYREGAPHAKSEMKRLHELASQGS